MMAILTALSRGTQGDAWAPRAGSVGAAGRGPIAMATARLNVVRAPGEIASSAGAGWRLRAGFKTPQKRVEA